MTPNGNEATGRIEIQLDRMRHLKFEWKTFEMLERKLGRGLLTGNQQDATFNGFTELKVFLWAGLLDDDPMLTEDKLAGMLSTKDIKLYSTKVQEAVILALPEAKKNDEGDAADSPPKPAGQPN